MFSKLLLKFGWNNFLIGVSKIIDKILNKSKIVDQLSWCSPFYLIVVGQNQLSSFCRTIDEKFEPVILRNQTATNIEGVTNFQFILHINIVPITPFTEKIFVFRGQRVENIRLNSS